MASSSEVLPWSTWPMIVTTGALGARSAGSSTNSVAAFLLFFGVLDLDLALELLGEDR